MKHSVLLGSLPILCTVLCAPGLAQQHVTSPPGFLNIEGNSGANAFGAFRDGHFMTFDGGFRGKAMTIKGLAFRNDNRLNTPSSTMGRSWTDVQISASECDTAKLSATFTRNPTTTPTLVHSASVSWPTLLGKPLSLPAKWDLSFPFNTSWVHSGKADICLDFRFFGGTLLNNGTWSGSRWQNYFLDSVSFPTFGFAESVELGTSGLAGGCNDRGVSHLRGAQVTSTCSHYGSAYPTASFRNNVRLSQVGKDFATSAPVFTVLGLRSVASGWSFPGVYCNKVYIDTTMPMALFPQVSDSSGALPTQDFGSGPNGAPASAGTAGVEFVTQAVWNDSKTKNPMFSSAAKIIVPKKPVDHKRSILYTWSPTRTSGAMESGPEYNAIARYTQ